MHILDEVQYLLMYDSLAEVSFMYVRKKSTVQYSFMCCKNIPEEPFSLITIE